MIGAYVATEVTAYDDFCRIFRLIEGNDPIPTFTVKQ